MGILAALQRRKAYLDTAVFLTNDKQIPSLPRLEALYLDNFAKR